MYGSALPSHTEHVNYFNDGRIAVWKNNYGFTDENIKHIKQKYSNGEQQKEFIKLIESRYIDLLQKKRELEKAIEDRHRHIEKAKTQFKQTEHEHQFHIDTDTLLLKSVIQEGLKLESSNESTLPRTFRDSESPHVSKSVDKPWYDFIFSLFETQGHRPHRRTHSNFKYVDALGLYVSNG